jgi:hypothetical protein
MKTGRLFYLTLIIITIVLGLISRKITLVPLWVGDVLWATMIFYMVRFVFIKMPIAQVVIISLLFCYGIELSQLYQAVWINQVRQTTFGKLVLGSVFSWGDMLSYTAGVGLGVLSIRLINPDKV